ncbi:hypothetical protein Hypma_015881 [Hypsizygus marmoreus]|uniref:Uncharacterized protein n=1 Tax=Hypsizygus marmoreus TaxID=39966 RepID=A0A369K1X1_HYPMA|nr:hypothetical protein Hypma_015881 [Hypsizygus marmoreus]
MTEDCDVDRIEEGILSNTPPFSDKYFRALFIVRTVIVPPNVGTLVATKVDHLAVEVWIDLDEFFEATVIDMSSRSVYVDSLRMENDDEIILDSGYTICFKPQSKKEGGVVNRLVHEWTNGGIINGNLLVFKHTRSGSLTNMSISRDLPTVQAVVAK